MRFYRYQIKPSGGRCFRPWTQRRLAAARRAVSKELSQVEMFPELARFSTVEERQRIIDEQRASFAGRMRSDRAANWHRARKCLLGMDPISARGVRKLWSVGGYSGDPVYLLDLIRRVKLGQSAWTTLRESKIPFNK